MAPSVSASSMPISISSSTTRTRSAFIVSLRLHTAFIHRRCDVVVQFRLVRDAKRIGEEKRALGRYLDGAICRAPQPSGALRYKVGIPLYLGCDFVEQLVDCDEARSANVPMCLFHLRVQIDR